MRARVSRRSRPDAAFPQDIMTEYSPIDPAARILGMHTIVPYALDNIDVTPLWTQLVERFQADESDAAALVDISTILQSQGQTDQALQVLGSALAVRRTFCVVHGDGTGPRLLAFVTPGDFMANTPLDFLFEGSNGVLWLHYVDAETTELKDLPEHDAAFMAIGESNENGPVLARMNELLADWPGPIMNNKPMLINSLTRDGVSRMFAQEPTILSPRTLRFPALQLQAVVGGMIKLSDLAQDMDFPIIVRPIGTHAGHGMECIWDCAELSVYMSSVPSESYYVAPFIDYRGEDGLFNKQRVVLIKGKPFASHMALSDHWMVHYLSAGMATNPEKRAVEARWMETFDEDYAVRHAAAFEALYRHIGLDYFGIDCAELSDGRLLVFELDVAMIVHAMDSAEIYPYKKVAMQRLFDAFVASITATRAGHAQRSAA